jgi:hypothetical protein
MNVYFLSLLEPNLQIKKKMLHCTWIPPLNYQCEVKNYPNLKKGDVVLVGPRYLFFDGSSLVESKPTSDSQGISYLITSPFLVTDTKFSPDYWVDVRINFRFSKAIRRRIMANFDPTTKMSRFRIGKKKWVYNHEWGSNFPLKKSTIFSINYKKTITSFTFDELSLFPIDRFLSNLWKEIEKWYKVHGG